MSIRLWSQVLTSWFWFFTPATQVFYSWSLSKCHNELVTFLFKKLWIIHILEGTAKVTKSKQKPTCMSLHLWHSMKGQGKFWNIVHQLLLLWKYFHTPFPYMLFLTTPSPHDLWQTKLIDYNTFPISFNLASESFLTQSSGQSIPISQSWHLGVNLFSY